MAGNLCRREVAQEAHSAGLTEGAPLCSLFEMHGMRQSLSIEKVGLWASAVALHLSGFYLKIDHRLLSGIQVKDLESEIEDKEWSIAVLLRQRHQAAVLQSQYTEAMAMEIHDPLQCAALPFYAQCSRWFFPS